MAWSRLISSCVCFTWSFQTVQEKHIGILFIPLRAVVRVCTDMVKEIMADLAWFLALFVVLHVYVHHLTF